MCLKSQGKIYNVKYSITKLKKSSHFYLSSMVHNYYIPLIPNNKMWIYYIMRIIQTGCTGKKCVLSLAAICWQGISVNLKKNTNFLAPPVIISFSYIHLTRVGDIPFLSHEPELYTNLLSTQWPTMRKSLTKASTA